MNNEGKWCLVLAKRHGEEKHFNLRPPNLESIAKSSLAAMA